MVSALRKSVRRRRRRRRSSDAVAVVAAAARRRRPSPAGSHRASVASSLSASEAISRRRPSCFVNGCVGSRSRCPEVARWRSSCRTAACRCTQALEVVAHLRIRAPAPERAEPLTRLPLTPPEPSPLLPPPEGAVRRRSCRLTPAPDAAARTCRCRRWSSVAAAAAARALSVVAAVRQKVPVTPPTPRPSTPLLALIAATDVHCPVMFHVVRRAEFRRRRCCCSRSP